MKASASATPNGCCAALDQGAGTCIDLSLLFAAQCLNEELDTYLVMLQGPGYGHVMVAVWLGMTAEVSPRNGCLQAPGELPASSPSTIARRSSGTGTCCCLMP